MYSSSQVFRTTNADISLAGITTVEAYVGFSGLLDSTHKLTLNATPNVGDKVIIKDEDGSLASFNFTIDGNGKTIDGAATLLLTAALVGSNKGRYELLYNGAAWVIVTTSVSNDGYWIPIFSALGAVYIDPVGGSDKNTGTILAPIKTFAEFVRRVGRKPQFRNLPAGFLIHWVNDQPNDTDPVDLSMILHNSSFFMEGTLIQVDSGTFGAVTNVTRSTAIQTTAFNANGAAPVNYWTQYIGMLVHDTTNDTWFNVDTDLGNRQAQFTKPYSGVASGINFTNAPSTITAGHSYVIYRYPRVYLGVCEQDLYGEGLIGDAVSSYQQFTHLHFSAASTGGLPIGACFKFKGSAYALIEECTFEGQAFIYGDVWEQTIIYNCFFLNGVTARQVLFLGGGSLRNMNISTEAMLDGDFMSHGDMEIQGNVAVGTAWVHDERVGHDFVDIPLWLPGAPYGGTLTLLAGNFGECALWGPFQLRVHANGKVFLGGGTAVATLLNTGGITITGLSTGAKVTPGAPRVITDGIAITPANIDDTTGGKLAGIVATHASDAGIFPWT